jgi:hypothetical protein
MNSRRTVLVLLLGGALGVVGAVAPAGVVAAAPAAPTSGAAFAVGPDPLVPVAVEALEALQGSIAAGQGDRSATYLVLRSEVAAEVAQRLGVDRAALRTAWAGADPHHQVALMAGLTQLGVRYRSMAREPGGGFDCSGLTSFAWSVAGYQIPRSSSDQIAAADPRDATTAQAGDLLRYPGHAMMWLGVGSAILHSPQSGDVVKVDLLSERQMARSRFGDPAG